MSALRDLLGIELPIIQAPMAGVQGSALAIAVSNAGGLASLPCALLSLEAMRVTSAGDVLARARWLNYRTGDLDGAERWLASADAMATSASLLGLRGQMPDLRSLVRRSRGLYSEAKEAHEPAVSTP